MNITAGVAVGELVRRYHQIIGFGMLPIEAGNQLDVGDMDLSCGVIMDGESSVAEVGRTSFDLILETAPGRKTLSEQLGSGQEESVPWQLAAVL